MKLKGGNMIIVTYAKRRRVEGKATGVLVPFAKGVEAEGQGNKIIVTYAKMR